MHTFQAVAGDPPAWSADSALAVCLLRCSFEDGLKLVDLRGKSMQQAADAQPSAMVSVIGLDADTVTA